MEKRKEIDMEMVVRLMDKHYYLSYVDYHDNLNDQLETIERCIESQNSDALFDDMNEWFYDQRAAAVINVMDELKNKLIKVDYKKWEAEKFFEENEDVIRETIYDRDNSNPIKDLLRNTNKIPVRIEFISNYDCINSHWFESSGGYGYKNSYFGDMVDVLNLNPYKVKKLLLEHDIKVFGKFPNKRSRNGKEQVSYEQFFEELENSVSSANLLTYTATIDVKELYDADFNLSEIIIPKGNMCGLFSSMQGGGSLIEMELKNDVKINLTKKSNYPYFRLDLEKNGNGYHYSIKQVYGVLDSFYGKPLSINTKPQIQ